MAKSSTGSQRHTHKYHKLSTGVWACALPNCTHFMPHNVAPAVEGKSSICWKCGEEFTLDTINMKQDKPKCDACSGIDKAGLDDFLKQAGL